MPPNLPAPRAPSKKPEWKDATSYSQSEPRPRTPRSWSLDFGAGKIIVHRLHGISDAWFFTCEATRNEATVLTSLDVEDAKAQAIGVVRVRLRRMIQDFEIAVGG